MAVKIIDDNIIEAIKYIGSITNLRQELRSQIWNIEKNWNNVEEKGEFIHIGKAIDDAEIILSSMKRILKALQEIGARDK